MKGVLKVSQQFLATIPTDMLTLLVGWIELGVVHKEQVDNGYLYTMMNHPHFTSVNKNTEYMLYFGNRYNRQTETMEPHILRLDSIGENGKLIPVKYYEKDYSNA